MTCKHTSSIKLDLYFCMFSTSTCLHGSCHSVTFTHVCWSYPKKRLLEHVCFLAWRFPSMSFTHSKKSRGFRSGYFLFSLKQVGIVHEETSGMHTSDQKRGSKHVWWRKLKYCLMPLIAIGQSFWMGFHDPPVSVIRSSQL